MGHSVNSELWGSELLHTNPEIMAGIHRQYAQAGADLVETCTYQLTSGNLSNYLSTIQASKTSSSPTFSYNENQNNDTSHTQDHDHDQDYDTNSLFCRSIDLVHTAFSSSPLHGSSINTVTHVTHSHQRTDKSKDVVFSCGPYGSTLRPGAEYSGLYPPPYGPSSSGSSEVGSDKAMNNFESSVEGQSQEEEAIRLLTKFHLDKLLTVALVEETWRKIEWIAFETIPLLYEIKAIRLAMGELYDLLRRHYWKAETLEDGWYKKKFWITCPFPNSQFPQMGPNGYHVEIDELMDTLISPTMHCQGQGQVGEAVTKPIPMPIPNGIGINCTNPSYLSSLSKEFTNALKGQLQRQREREQRPKVSFVCYPDGGQVYDVHTRSWSTPLGGSDPDEWAKGLLSIAREVEKAKFKSNDNKNDNDNDNDNDCGDGKESERNSEGEEYVWDGVIVGGCCKTSFDEIRALKTNLDKMYEKE
nr:uncharacterized protein I303_01671 [Kwoniella dejecticola CBS 10117]OBR87466.1 hypothetical protein I303_01671 [Kwoniella dejecticola CBS 10117]